MTGPQKYVKNTKPEEVLIWMSRERKNQDADESKALPKGLFLRSLAKLLKKNSWKKRSEIPSLKITAKAPENVWLEYYLLSFWGPAYFQGLVLLVSGRVGTSESCLYIRFGPSKNRTEGPKKEKQIVFHAHQFSGAMLIKLRDCTPKRS